MNRTYVDITPHPAILTVLGEIEFKPWQCIAELVDNSIDGFLKMAREGTPIDDPLVQIAFGRESVVVKDNGPGMSIDLLEMAVKAGWTSNERFGNLGLYGVGFNIATARLGSLTKIWTTRSGDTLWYGLDIDLKKMASGATYSLEIRTRPKSDAQESGTEIEVSRIKPDWVNLLTNTSWLKNNVTERLARIYGTMLRDINPQPIKFSLRVNNKKVTGWQHVVWPGDWTVFRKNEGLIRPIQEIDLTFGTKYISRSTGETYDTPDGLSEADVVEVTERVYGWLGIQRYADEHEFGLDILRNGRKIEIDSKDIFNWEGDDGNTIPEYPIDDPRHRGRIVGEIHLDHGYVHYTKHRFEREHSSWKQLLQAVRHAEPLTNRGREGFTGVNDSPLGLLFRVFRRNSPSAGQKYWDVLLIKENDKAKRWAQEYRKGTKEYLDENFWRDEINKADIANDPPPPPPPSDVEGEQPPKGNGNGEGGSLKLATPEETDIGLNTGMGTEQPQNGKSEDDAQSKRTPVSALTVHVNSIGVSGKPYDMAVYTVEDHHLNMKNPPWKSRVTERGVFEVEVNINHQAFNSTSLQVSDAVLADFAHYITSEEISSTGMTDGISYGQILATLRSWYATSDSLDNSQLRVDIEDLRKRLTSKLARVANESEQRELLNHLSQDDARRIELALARGGGSAIVSYFEMSHLAFLLRQDPAWFFDKGCFTASWTPSTLAQNETLLVDYRTQIVQDLWILMVKMGEFANPLSASIDNTRSYLSLVRACINRMRDYLPGA